MIRALVLLAVLSACALPSLPAGAQSASGAYLLHPGDRLSITVVGQPSLSQPQIVGPDGDVDLPLAGRIRVAGTTTVDAAAAIGATLSRYLRHPSVTVDVVAEGKITVTVSGDVRRPGQYQLRPGAHVSEALAAAGGVNPTNGPYPVARVLADGTLTAVPLEAVLRGGDALSDTVLADRATVYVPSPERFDVQVIGAVDHPGVVAVSAGDRLSMAIAMAGDSVAAKADLTHIFVTRTEPDGVTASHEVDLYQAIRKNDVRYDPLLRKNDVIWVPQDQHVHGALSSGAYLLANLFSLGL